MCWIFFSFLFKFFLLLLLLFLSFFFTFFSFHAPRVDSGVGEKSKKYTAGSMLCQPKEAQKEYFVVFLVSYFSSS